MPVTDVFKIEDPDDMDQLVAFFKDTTGAIKLSPKLESQLNKYMTVHSLIQQYSSRSVVVKFMVKMFGYSERQAYTDFKNTQILFGSVSKVEKDFERQWAMDVLKRAIAMAIDDRDLRSLSALMKEFRETAGYTTDDTELPDFSQFQLKRVMVGFFPELNKLNLPDPEELEKRINEILKSKKKGGINLDGIEEAQEV